MSKNILIISSSMSGTRNTKKLCKQFEKGAIESSNNVELLELRGKKINYCLGCNTCQKNGGTCVYKDDVEEILEKMSILYMQVILFSMTIIIKHCQLG